MNGAVVHFLYVFVDCVGKTLHPILICSEQWLQTREVCPCPPHEGQG
jgi:hypothetical protein